MKFFDLFAGIGGFRLGMEVAGHECVGFCEIDKFARASYKAIHDTEGEVELHDITEVSDDTIRGIGHVDVICGGFPCQAFSIAGARRGFEDTRGTLFFEITRFASILRPKLLLLENVKGLLNHDRGDTFKTILGALDELGYDVEWEVLNSKILGSPKIGNVSSLSDILEDNVPEKYFLSDRTAQKLICKTNNQQIPLPQDTQQPNPMGRILLKVNKRRFAN